ncbi:Ras-related protein Rab-40C [Portunus trituberculatus]|uniref:Ras-related protein Rab-40C n=1 Tax=Portunus trituberculatus TaxID=210409 RepID=A0A5B7CUE5_PORTR|nr:Ras-related protein Rab-40C [Portunus trituberculatus]
MSMMSDGGGQGGGESSKPYDYLLKFLLVGDSDVGKHEILQPLEDGSTESPFCVGSVVVLQHAPGVPKVLIGNRLHLAFKRQVSQSQAEQYAAKNHVNLFEVSPLCDFNIVESFTELSRLALKRNGMERLWRANKVLTLQELCSRAIVASTTVYGIEHLPLPQPLKSHLKSYTIHNHTTRLRQSCPPPMSHRHLPPPTDLACTNTYHSPQQDVLLFKEVPVLQSLHQNKTNMDSPTLMSSNHHRRVFV